jgi:hypothetical protein
LASAKRIRSSLTRPNLLHIIVIPLHRDNANSKQSVQYIAIEDAERKIAGGVASRTDEEKQESTEDTSGNATSHPARRRCA